MRLIPVIAAALILFCSCPSFAQGWIEYASQQDFFTINFRVNLRCRTAPMTRHISSPCRRLSIATRMAPAATRSLWSIMGRRRETRSARRKLPG